MTEDAKVEYEIKGQPFDPEAKASGNGEAGAYGSRIVRRLLIAQGKKLKKKFGHLQHPVTGERPRLVVNVPDPSKASLQHRLVADSESLREWLKSKGIVVEEIVQEDEVASEEGDRVAESAPADDVVEDARPAV